MKQRLIDANSFKQQLQMAEGLEIDRYGNIHTNVNALNIALERSTIDAEPVRHGKWKQSEIAQECFDIDGNKTWGIKYMCESCGFKTIAIEGHFAQYKYCPNCGSKMDEE